jgi:hypothetical protein
VRPTATPFWTPAKPVTGGTPGQAASFTAEQIAAAVAAVARGRHGGAPRDSALADWCVPDNGG